MSTVIDYSAGPPSAAAIKAAGHVGAVRYISEARPEIASWASGKPVRRAEIDDFDQHGLKVAFVWQYGKESDSDVRRGFAGGVADATAAQLHLNEIQCSGHPVYFAVDFDISLEEWNDFGIEYFRGAAEVLGLQRVGIYGHSKVCHWAGPEDKVVAEVEPGRYLAWVTRSWSNGASGSDYAVLYQGRHNVPGPDGVQIDINTVYHPEWGWRSLADHQQLNKESEPVSSIQKSPGRKGDPTWLPEVLRAFGVEVVEDKDWKLWGMGDFGSIWGVVAHHTGANNTSTDFIRYNPMLSNALSSQIHLSRSGVATLVGAGIAWHAGAGNYPGIAKNAANQVTIGIEAQSDGVSAWPVEELDAYYRICAAILWYLGLDSSRVIAHFEWSAQGKWDPGAGNGKSGHRMDMNAFRRNVQRYIDNPPFTTEEGLFMSLPKERQEELASKIDRIHHELTHRYQSRFEHPETGERSGYRDTMIGYVLELDKKVEAINAHMLPAIWDTLVNGLKNLVGKGGK